MNAKRNSKCTECRIEIYEGDRIVYDPETYKAYCDSCGEEVAGTDPKIK